MSANLQRKKLFFPLRGTKLKTSFLLPKWENRKYTAMAESSLTHEIMNYSLQNKLPIYFVAKSRD